MLKFILFIALSSGTFAVHAGETLDLTIDIPKCKPPAGRPLPPVYYSAVTKKGSYWAQKVTLADSEIFGNGWPRVDGSDLITSFEFYRVDLNNDGICDWFLNSSAPLSTGGDRDSINTFYIGKPNGWLRIGASMTPGKPDVLGEGKSADEQEAYLFGEDIATIYDRSHGVNYLISGFYNRHVQQSFKPGYRVYVWDEQRQTLRMLDKWEPDSAAAQVYQFFKDHGASLPALAGAKSHVLEFDKDLEKDELRDWCNPSSFLRKRPEDYGPVSEGLLQSCPTEKK